MIPFVSELTTQTAKGHLIDWIKTQALTLRGTFGHVPHNIDGLHI